MSAAYLNRTLQKLKSLAAYILLLINVWTSCIRFHLNHHRPAVNGDGKPQRVVHRVSRASWFKKCCDRDPEEAETRQSNKVVVRTTSVAGDFFF